MSTYSRKLSILCGTFCIVGLASCAPTYVQPVSLSRDQSAVVEESTIHVWTPRLPTIKTEIVEVDGKITGRFGTTAVIVEPGRHAITFGTYYSDGVGPFGDIGNVTFTATLEAGHTYVLNSTNPTIGFLNLVHATAWMQDQRGYIVTSTTPLTLPGPGINVP